MKSIFKKIKNISILGLLFFLFSCENNDNGNSIIQNKKLIRVDGASSLSPNNFSIIEKYKYDNDNNLIEVIENEITSQTYEYNSERLLIKHKQNRDSNNVKTTITTNYFYKNGLLTSFITNSISFNSLNEILSKDTENHIVENNNNIQVITNKETGFIGTFTYNNRNQLISIDRNSKITHTFNYDSQNNVTSITDSFPNSSKPSEILDIITYTNIKNTFPKFGNLISRYFNGAPISNIAILSSPNFFETITGLDIKEKRAYTINNENLISTITVKYDHTDEFIILKLIWE